MCITIIIYNTQKKGPEKILCAVSDKTPFIWVCWRWFYWNIIGIFLESFWSRTVLQYCIHLETQKEYLKVNRDSPASCLVAIHPVAALTLFWLRLSGRGVIKEDGRIENPVMIFCVLFCCVDAVTVPRRAAPLCMAGVQSK